MKTSQFPYFKYLGCNESKTGSMCHLSSWKACVQHKEMPDWAMAHTQLLFYWQQPNPANSHSCVKRQVFIIRHCIKRRLPSKPFSLSQANRWHKSVCHLDGKPRKKNDSPGGKGVLVWWAEVLTLLLSAKLFFWVPDSSTLGLRLSWGPFVII